ncbi:hypothetical protein G9A89_014792 [Geosiphon pyriformis]|nr:hypothetical protein G9A89_014792 [Geosiphon pyriformis]
MKKTSKVSGSEGGFKVVVLRKKKKGGVLTESVDNRGVAAEAPSARSWNSETGDTTKSESIDMKEECLVEETSIDYGKSGAFTEGNPNQIPKGLYVKTKKILGKPLDMINYETVNIDDNILDNFFLLLPPLSVKPSIQVPVRKSFALDIDLMAIAGKFSQKKVNFGRKIFLGVNGFGGPLLFQNLAIMAAAQLANNHGVVVNTDLKHPINNRTNRAIVLKEIPMGTSIEAAIVELEDQNQADLLAAEWFILIGKDAVCVAQTNIDRQMWDVRNEFKALLYTLPMSINAHDL